MKTSRTRTVKAVSVSASAFVFCLMTSPLCAAQASALEEQLRSLFGGGKPAPAASTTEQSAAPASQASAPAPAAAPSTPAAVPPAKPAKPPAPAPAPSSTTPALAAPAQTATPSSASQAQAQPGPPALWSDCTESRDLQYRQCAVLPQWQRRQCARRLCLEQLSRTWAMVIDTNRQYLSHLNLLEEIQKLQRSIKPAAARTQRASAPRPTLLSVYSKRAGGAHYAMLRFGDDVLELGEGEGHRGLRVRRIDITRPAVQIAPAGKRKPYWVYLEHR